MKTVWVIEQGSYSDYRVVGVFSSEANAKFIADAINVAESYDKATIAEWSLDPAVDELPERVRPILRSDAGRRHDGSRRKAR